MLNVIKYHSKYMVSSINCHPLCKCKLDWCRSRFRPWKKQRHSINWNSILPKSKNKNYKKPNAWTETRGQIFFWVFRLQYVQWLLLLILERQKLILAMRLSFTTKRKGAKQYPPKKIREFWTILKATAKYYKQISCWIGQYPSISIIMIIIIIINII